MNLEAIEYMRLVLKKPVNELSEAERAFIRARKSYIPKDVKIKYTTILKKGSIKKSEEKDEKVYTEKPDINEDTK